MNLHSIYEARADASVQGARISQNIENDDNDSVGKDIANNENNDTSDNYDINENDENDDDFGYSD